MEVAKHCTATLRSIIRPHILRRTKQMLKEDCKLPDRNEFIVFCTPTRSQVKLYALFLESTRAL